MGEEVFKVYFLTGGIRGISSAGVSFRESMNSSTTGAVATDSNRSSRSSAFPICPQTSPLANSVQGAWCEGSIHGSTLFWKGNAGTVAITWISSTEFCIKDDAGTCTAKLVDGKLVWDDGDVWTRGEKDKKKSNVLLAKTGL